MKKILSELQVNESAISRELDRELEYLLSSKVLLKAVEKGMGREAAHSLILESATESRSSSSETFFELLAKNKELALSLSELEALKSNPDEHLGAQQVLKLVRTQISALKKFGNQSLDEISN
jgi:adenylosuccinate lyase